MNFNSEREDLPMSRLLSVSSGPKVVILGSGYAGAKCARAIQSKLGTEVDLFVIDKRTCNIHKMAASRAAVVGEKFTDRILIPNQNLIIPGKGQMINEQVKEVKVHEVILKNGMSVPFDYLVCATGAVSFSVAEPPLKYSSKKSMQNFYDKVAKKIEVAKKILIVGGGPVGVEMAGEIKYEFANKDVTIVHSGPNLLSSLHPPPSKSFFTQLEDRLKTLGIEVVVDQKLNIQSRKPYIVGETVYTTDKGRQLEADLVLYCTGKRLDNGMYPREWRDPVSARLRVMKTLQLVEHPHIFAVGDVNDYEENKQGYFAGKQGAIAATNIKRLIQGKPLAKYNPGFGTGRTFIFVSLGRKLGVSYLGFLSIGDGFTSMIKSKDLFVSDWWKTYRAGDDIPKERGGPSKGGRLNVVQKAPNLMDPQKKKEMQPQSRFSLESSASIAEGYDNDIYGITPGPPGLPSLNPSKMMSPNGGKMNRRDVISFVGGKTDGDMVGQGNKLGMRAPSFVPMTDEELNNSRTMPRHGSAIRDEPPSLAELNTSQPSILSGSSANFDPNNKSGVQPAIIATQGRSKKKRNKKGTPLENLNFGGSGKPKRDEIISFVGSQGGSQAPSVSPSGHVPILSPLSAQELDQSRQKTLQRNKEEAKNPLAPLQNLAFAGKPNRNEVISFVGTGHGANNTQQNQNGNANQEEERKENFDSGMW